MVPQDYKTACAEVPVTRHHIIFLADDDVILQNCLHYWRRGDITWEQAMMMAVKFLCEQNKGYRNKLVEWMNHNPAPFILRRQ